MGMGGVQRTLKFSKYLHKFGWKPFILTDTPKVYFARDSELLSELSPGTFELYRTKRSGSKNLMTEDKTFRMPNERARKFLSALGQTFMIPDTKRWWKNRAIRLGEEIIDTNNIDLIYATAPPYTDFLIGYELHVKYNIPLVLDYRDLWVDCLNNVYPTPLHRSINTRLERETLSAAAKIICINPRIKEILLEKYATINPESIVVIPQGFDRQDFSKSKNGQTRPPKMRLTYAGSFLYYYTPKYFLEGLSLAFRRHPELKNNIEACFIGHFPDEHLKLIKEYGLEDAVVMTGYLNHCDCITNMMNSDVLWMMINKTRVSDMHSTGKLYEYFGTRKPILACVPEGVARETLKEYGAVKLCEPDDPEAIAKSILDFYRLYENNSLPTPDENVVMKYDRESLTCQLADEFNSVLSFSDVIPAQAGISTN